MAKKAKTPRNIYYATICDKTTFEAYVWESAYSVKGLVKRMYEHMWVALDFTNKAEEMKARRELVAYIENNWRESMCKLTFNYGGGFVGDNEDDVMWVQRNKADMVGN